MHFSGEQRVNAYRSVCAILQFGERMHKEFTAGQFLGFVHLHASTHRGHCHLIGKGAES